MQAKNDIRNINEDELAGFVDESGEKSYRKGQVSDWLWKKGAGTWDEMKNIPSDFRKKLSEKYEIRPLTVAGTEISADGTRKLLFRMYDGNYTEGVLIPSVGRTTACISTQAGCPLKCAFCATGQHGFKRNLDPGEIFDQFILLNRLSAETCGRPLSNLVLMGMGEPFLNIFNVLKALGYISSPRFVNFSPSRITVSTIGIPEKIIQAADSHFPYQLALSLHSSIPGVRDEIIPAASRYSLKELQQAMAYFTQKTKKPVTVEFLLLKGVNTSSEEAESLVRYCSSFSSKINLITYNEVPGLPFFKPEENEVAQFLAYLKKKHMVATLRRSMGSDISAACGQLANRSKLVK
jgi:23S rRNA (adenine2503-C2)-methyltransferase